MSRVEDKQLRMLLQWPTLKVRMARVSVIRESGKKQLIGEHCLNVKLAADAHVGSEAKVKESNSEN